jgi:hypothetical protein
LGENILDDGNPEEIDMPQSALTVTTANPTPPTNFIFVGNTPPLDPAQVAVDDGIPAQTPNAKSVAAANGHSLNELAGQTYPVGILFTTNTAAANTAGAPGAGISNAHEARGSETSSTATSPTPLTIGQLVMVGVGPAETAATRAAGPNASHASTLSGSAVPTLTGATGASNVSGGGTTTLTATGTNFNRGSVINVSGVPQNTSYVSATSLTAGSVPKKQTVGAGNLPVTVTSNGITTASVNWVFT